MEKCNNSAKADDPKKVLKIIDAYQLKETVKQENTPQITDYFKSLNQIEDTIRFMENNFTLNTDKG